ncbi:MAG: RNA-binding protein [Thermodesulfobacteriota bacterium]|nr:RNA-binding protein [Thermodesulfobacteriota bacterium]
MRGKKLFVGNLSHCVAAAEETEQLRKLFSDYGEVEGVNIVKGKRYGFVEMSNPSEAEKAKRELNDFEFNGSSLTVNEVRPPKRRPGGRGYRRY